MTAREDGRADLRAEQLKIAPGRGMGPAFDRAAWTAAGQRVAGVWNWAGVAGGLATFAVIALVLVVAVDARPAPLLAGFAVLVVMMARARWLHVRHLRRAAPPADDA